MIEPMPNEQAAVKILRGLQEDSATGPDFVLIKMLRECADALAKSFRMLALVILQQNVWPEALMIHRIIIFFKKGVSFQRGNYIGIHFTAHMSKAMERFLWQMVVTFIRTSLHTSELREHETHLRTWY